MQQRNQIDKAQHMKYNIISLEKYKNEQFHSDNKQPQGLQWYRWKKIDTSWSVTSVLQHTVA